jgi:hypothetical protein
MRLTVTLRNATLFLGLVGMAVFGFAALTPMTGAQLEQRLSTVRDQPDAEVAKELSQIELSERLSAARLSRCEAGLPGPRSREALMAVADVAAFLDPAAADVPALKIPSVEAQRQMIGATVDYVTKTMHQLPNFFATRSTTTFQDDPWFQESATDFTNYLPLRVVGKSSASVLYRQGKEVITTEAKQGGPRKSEPIGLTTSGEFGPILVTAVLDAGRGKLYWSHWEQGAKAPIAVFRFEVSAEKSHYKVADRTAGYRGELAVDPSDGTIWWLTLRANRLPNDPLAKVDLRVEYSPVTIGEETHICPTKGIELSVVRDIQLARASPVQIFLNDVVFADYHLYEARIRILGGEKVDPGGDMPDRVRPQVPQ